MRSLSGSLVTSRMDGEMFILLLSIALSPFLLLGFGMAYAGYRFARRPQVDTSAGFAWYLAMCWSLATQTEEIAEHLPFVKKELTQALWRKS